jgi:hypothetical protein
VNFLDEKIEKRQEMTTATPNEPTKLDPKEARQGTLERPVLKILLVSLAMAAVAAAVLAYYFQF